jgi:multicomponent Na+:H+ antiporter subunit D
LGKRIKGLGDSLANLGTLILAGLSVYSVFLVRQAGIHVYKVGGWVPPVGISLVLDGLSSFFLVTVNITALLITIFSISYMERYTAKPKFYILFMLMVAGMNGVIITGDMFNLFVFLEIAAIASYALVAFGIEHEELEASFKYMVMGELASLLILLGIALLYSFTSTLNMADMGGVLAIRALSGANRLVPFVSVLFLVGFGLKAAIMPFHAWLPDAHPSAPAPISAMLSGLLIKVLGIYALIRIFFNVLGTSLAVLNVFLALGTISMIAGALLAIGQKDIKRMLAYSSISQIGYIIFALGIATPLALLGALFHLFNHAIFKSLLFLNSGAIEYATGTRDLTQMGGLNKRMPLTGATNLIGSMSISGIPPLSGFWSKLIIILAAIKSGHSTLGFIAILASIITLGYYLKLQKLAFWGRLQDKLRDVQEVAAPMKLSMVLLALISIAAGLLLLPGVRESFLELAGNIVYVGKDYAQILVEAIK